MWFLAGICNSISRLHKVSMFCKHVNSRRSVGCDENSMPTSSRHSSRPQHPIHHIRQSGGDQNCVANRHECHGSGRDVHRDMDEPSRRCPHSQPHKLRNRNRSSKHANRWLHFASNSNFTDSFLWADHIQGVLRTHGTHPSFDWNQRALKIFNFFFFFAHYYPETELL